MEKKKVCVITGSRAEYSILKPTLMALRESDEIELQLIVTGMHLASAYGNTYQAIVEDGFSITSKIDMLIDSDLATSLPKSVGLATISFTDHYEWLKPDLVLVLGDRYEILAAVQAAFLLNLKVLHLHGGETTEGALDDGIRNAVSHMSFHHMPVAAEYKAKLVQMGVDEKDITVISTPGLENFKTTTALTIEELGQMVGLDLSDGFLLLTYHPETKNPEKTIPTLKNILSAVEKINHLRVLMTKSNSDTGGSAINAHLEAYCAAHPERCVLVSNLGTEGYISALTHATIVLGNSSSAVIEAPAIDTPSINIGNRQGGRLMAKSVISCGTEEDEIWTAMQQAVDPAFKRKLQKTTPPYGRPAIVSKQIHDTIRKILSINQD